MKKIIMTSFLSLFCFFTASRVHGGLYIHYPADVTPSIDVQQAYHDDDGDDDQTFSEKHVNYIQVTNSARRYVGVYIERCYPLPLSKIDNGPNDELLIAREELISWESYQTMMAAAFVSHEEAREYMDKSRHYILPIPDSLEPGEDVRFNIKVLGPGSSKSYYPVSAGSDEESLLNAAIGSTVWAVFASKIIGLMTGEGSRYEKVLEELTNKNMETWPLTVYKDFLESSSSWIKWWTMYQQGEQGELVIDIVKSVLQMDTLHQYLKLKENCEYLVAVRDNLNLPVIVLADWYEALAHIYNANFEDVFEVRIIRPRIDELVPSKGEAGSSILIKGVGFYSEAASDEDKKMFTDIYFTTLNNNQMPVTILKAREFTVVNENEIWVTVPEGVYPGPVQVCVDGLCSNEVNFADEFKTSLNITDPQEGDLLAGTTLLVAEVVDPPADFPEYPATARFFIDGQKISEKSVQSIQFMFTIDIDPLANGVHTARVEMEFPGHIISDSISFSKGYKALDLSAVNRVSVEFITKNPYKHTDPSQGDIITEEGFDERKTVRVFSAPGKFDQNRYFAEWYDVGYGNVEIGGFISVLFNPTHDVITEISFFRYERDRDPGSTYLLEETFKATSKPADGSSTENANIIYQGKSFGGLTFGSFKEDVCRNIDDYSYEQQKNPKVKITEEKGSCIDSSYLRIVLYAD